MHKHVVRVLRQAHLRRQRLRLGVAKDAAFCFYYHECAPRLLQTASLAMPRQHSAPVYACSSCTRQGVAAGPPLVRSAVQ